MPTLLHRLKHAFSGYDFAPPLHLPELNAPITDLMPAAALLSHQEQRVSPVTPYGDITVPLTRGRVIQFQLTPKDCNEITGLQLRLSTLQRINHSHLIIRINGQLHRLNARDFIDQAYFNIHLPQPLSCVAGEPLHIELFSDDATEDNCIAIACSQLLPPLQQPDNWPPALHFAETAQPPRVSVIIALDDHANYAYNCLLQLQSYAPEITKELIVIKLCADEAINTLCEHLSGAVTCLEAESTLDLVAAYRQGVAAAHGDLIWLLSADTQVFATGLQAAVAAFDRHSDIGMIGSKLLMPSGLLHSAGGFLFNDGSYRHYGQDADPTLPAFNENREADYCSGASLLIRRSVWDAVGGVDLRYAPAGYHDLDLCVAVREAGYRVWYCHEMVAVHHGTVLTRPEYLGQQMANREQFVAKWQAQLAAHYLLPTTDETGALCRLEHNSYQQRYQKEIANYQHVENVHDLPIITADYWGPTYLAPIVREFGFTDANNFYGSYFANLCREFPQTTCQFLSVGAGNADTEIKIIQYLLEQSVNNFVLTCLDINPHMLERGRTLAAQHQVEPYIDFLCSDINGWQPNTTYHAVIANQSLHHFVELETLFDRIVSVLHPQGYFLTHDMIGRNGHMRWPEALQIVQELWQELTEEKRYNHLLQRYESSYINWDCSQEGFEGIRSQDILPLLLERFNFELFIGYGNVIDIFIDRCFGHNFDINNPADVAFIDKVQQLDQAAIEAGEVKPTHMIAAMMHPDTPCETRVYKHLTPEFCVRRVE